MNVATDDGVTLHVEAEGAAGRPALLLSNSLGTALGMWDPQVASLRERFRIVRYDSRGHGRSSVPSLPYTMERLGRDALAVLDALQIERAAFCGLSKGGMVGQWLGAHAPHRIERLVLANTAAQLGPVTTWNTRIDTVRAGGMMAITETVLERWFTPAFRESNPDDVNRIRDMLHTTPAQGYAYACAAIRDMDQRPLLPTIKVPTLVIAGKVDPATPPALAEEIANAIPGATLELFDAAHLSNIERADQFTRVLADFLEG